MGGRKARKPFALRVAFAMAGGPAMKQRLSAEVARRSSALPALDHTSATLTDAAAEPRSR
jgi:hypothetical protein